MRFGRACSKELTKFVNGKASVSHDVAHRDGMHRVVTRDTEYARPISHHEMLTLAGDPKSGLFQGTNRIEVVDAREFWYSYTSTRAGLAFAD